MAVQLLSADAQEKFKYALPSPPVLDATKGGSFTIQASQVDDFFLGLEDSSGNPLYTKVWSYQWLKDGSPVSSASYLGPTIIANEGAPVRVNWLNNLTANFLPIDETIHKADPMAAGAVPMVTHLHGGHSDAASDGYPEAWFTSNFAETGAAWGTPVYTYDNSQQAATLWYHDHTLGYTPQNVYGGLAGFYLLRDQNFDRLTAAEILPSGQYEVGLAIQDRTFTSDGQLYMPGASLDDPIPGTEDTVGDMLPPDYNGPLPTALPEFFGDFNLVNGMAWPNLNVAKGEYLFHFLNGSDSRFYVLRFDDPRVKLTLAGTDGGLLRDAAVISDGVDTAGDGKPDADETLILAPGDRVDVVVDFSNIDAGQAVHLENIGPAYEPFKGLGAAAAEAGVVYADPETDPIGEVMQFSVNGAMTPFHSRLFSSTADTTPNVTLNPTYQPLRESSATKVRKLGLYETEDQYGRILPLLGTAENTVDIKGNPVKAGALMWDASTTETPMLNSTEAWQIFNYTEDAHPIHLHQVQYQVLGRYMISPVDTNGDGLLNDLGKPLPLRPEDEGRQDTVWVGPGEALKIIQQFDLPGDYVWHCHILSHENNEMMRPLHVINTIIGTAKNETLTGTDDTDSIDPGRGNDVVNAGAGDDRIVVARNDGADVYDGGPGTDTLDLSKIDTAMEVSLGAGVAKGALIGGDRRASIENVIDDMIARGAEKNLASDAASANWLRMIFDGLDNVVAPAKAAEAGVDRLVSIENVIGGAADDKIAGDAQDNLLAGGPGADLLQGEGGDDRLWGQAGDDMISGGEGADTFLYYRNLQNKVDFGRDAISDFDPTVDVLEIDNTIFADFSDFVSHANETSAGVVLTYDGVNTITLRNNSLADLQANSDHFVFVGPDASPWTQNEFAANEENPDAQPPTGVDQIADGTSALLLESPAYDGAQGWSSPFQDNGAPFVYRSTAGQNAWSELANGNPLGSTELFGGTLQFMDWLALLQDGAFSGAATLSGLESTQPPTGMVLAASSVASAPQAWLA